MLIIKKICRDKWKGIRLGNSTTLLLLAITKRIELEICRYLLCTGSVFQGIRLATEGKGFFKTFLFHSQKF